MAAADYLRCDQCDCKLIYLGDTDYGDDVLAFCSEDCLYEYAKKHPKAPESPPDSPTGSSQGAPSE